MRIRLQLLANQNWRSNGCYQSLSCAPGSGYENGHAFEVCVFAHVALRAFFFALSQPVSCIFWPMKVLNWLVAASKLHRHWETCCTAGWPYCAFAILCHEPTVTTKQKSCKKLSTGYYFVFKYFLRYEPFKM